jgi:hypothetical protein
MTLSGERRQCHTALYTNNGSLSLWVVNGSLATPPSISYTVTVLVSVAATCTAVTCAAYRDSAYTLICSASVPATYICVREHVFRCH